MSIPLSTEVNAMLDSEPFKEVIRKYEDFWFGDWVKKVAIKVQVDCWQFNRNGIVKISPSGVPIKWQSLRTEDKVDFIIGVHNSMLDKVERALLDLKTKCYIMIERQ